jgi:hypothetical protein
MVETLPRGKLNHTKAPEAEDGSGEGGDTHCTVPPAEIVRGVPHVIGYVPECTQSRALKEPLETRPRKRT